MNTDTTTLITRPYQEVVDDVLTAIVGGVVNEPIVFDLKETLYPLSKPASGVRSVTGTSTSPGAIDPLHTAFILGTDFVFDTAKHAIVWQPAGAHPDDETVFYVDYYLRNATSPLTDINVGSVTRTLAEAVSREIATVYQQIYIAYLSGFVDTAQGQALDLVVSILDITRLTKDEAVGLVTFFRDPAVEGNITVAQATEMLTADGKVTFQTSDEMTLQNGHLRMDVPVRAEPAFKGPAGVVPAGAITTLAEPIAGISRITNLQGTVLGAKDETDDELRARAKAALHSVGKATLLALMRVVADERAHITEIWDPNSGGPGSGDPNSPPIVPTDPGKVSLLIETDPARFPSVQDAVNQTRAAGVQATVVARYIFLTPHVVARIAAGLPADGKAKVKSEIIDALQSYVNTLKSGQPAQGQELMKAVANNVKEVGSVDHLRFADVLTAHANVGQPGSEVTLEAIVQALLALVTPAALNNRDALQTAFTNVLTPPPPTFERIPDQSLLQGAGGRPPMHADIEAGNFTVNATIGKDKWWIVLDMDPTDIVLVES